MPRLTAKRMERVLERAGWEYERQSGSHRIFSHPNRPGTVTLPMHRGELKTGTQRGIMTQAGLTADDLRELLK